MNSFINYLKETRVELRHVTWPSVQTTLIFTAIVIALSVAVAVFLGAFDFLFTYLLERIISR